MKKKLIALLYSKYAIVTYLFIIQLGIFESIDLFTLYKLKRQESELQRKVKVQEKEIEDIKLQSENLVNPHLREKFARERYHFKKPNETIFIISNE